MLLISYYVVALDLMQTDNRIDESLLFPPIQEILLCSWSPISPGSRSRFPPILLISYYVVKLGLM